MSDLKALSDEMAKLKRQIETVLYISGYNKNSDLSGLSDYRQIKSADDWQKVEEYEGILYKLDEMQSRMDYTTKPWAKPLGIKNCFLFSADKTTPNHFPKVSEPSRKSTATSKTSPFTTRTSLSWGKFI